MEVIYLNYFPNNDEEISLIKFIAKYQYLNTKDVPYFFSAKRYCRDRIKNLINKKLVRKSKQYLVLDKFGIEYCKLFNFEYNTLNTNQKYKQRLLRLSNIAAFYNNCPTVKFTPSFDLKDKDVFTLIARKYIGIFDINGIEYLAYQISDVHDDRYISSIIYDIQKERIYKNIIILTNNLSRINLQNFAFGANQVLVIEDTEEARENLKYLNSLNWEKAISTYFKNDIRLSEYNFCDYTNHKDKYISTFYFIDTEKINRLKCFLRENKNRNVIIICNKDIESNLRKELPNAHYISIDLKEYIDKERTYYD